MLIKPCFHGKNFYHMEQNLSPSLSSPLCKKILSHWYYYLIFLANIALFAYLCTISASLWPDDQDGINFLLGVEQYDISFHQPHFPGYPLYILTGKFFTFFTGSTERALILVSVVSGVLSLIIFFIFTAQPGEIKAALLSVLFLSIHPVFFEFSHKIFSEIYALTFLLLAVAVLKDPDNGSAYRYFFSGLFFGCLLGVRLSFWPFPVFYFVLGLSKKKQLPIFWGILFGVFIWLIPQAIVIGLKNLIDIGFSFVIGHFTKWGGGIGTQPKEISRFLSILKRIGETMGFLGSGIQVTKIPWGLFLFFCIVKKRHINTSPHVKTFLYATLFYVVWVSFGQNVEKVRHFIPIIPAMILFIAPMFSNYYKTSCWVILVFSLGLPIDYATRTVSDPPAAQLQAWAASQLQENSAFYCGNTERYFDRYETAQTFISVPHIEKLDFIITSTWPKPTSIYVCDDILGYTSNKTPAKIFYPREGDPVDRPLKIYKLNSF